jgi:hypothetical protein
MLIAATVLAVSTARADIIYVDGEAPPGGDGSSWNAAYRFLQDALASGAGTGIEIRVAQGTYVPDRSATSPGGTGDRAATFHLLGGVPIFGGFAGLGTADPDMRDIVQFATVLSGDLAGDDGPPGGFMNNDENSRNVVTGDDADPSTVLDGLSVTGGNADGPNHQNDRDLWHLARGGGIWNATGSPTLIDCRIEYNVALMRGGGMYNLTNTNPDLTRCTFRGNVVLESVDGHGGGLRNFESNATVTDCVFVDNSAGRGGGMDVSSGSVVVAGCVFTDNSSSVGAGLLISFGAPATVSDCTFTGNTASRGGGMSVVSATATVTNCTFIGNASSVFGGGIFNDQSSLTVTNCALSGNSANYGGGLFVSNSSTTVISCTISGNTANTGGGMWNFDSTLTVANCVLRDDIPDEIVSDADGVTTVLYSNVQSGASGMGNIDADPFFVGGPSGTWTDSGVFDPAADLTTYTDTNAAFAPGGLVGGSLNPFTGFPAERPIVANTATTISVATDVALLGVPGFGYQVNDYHLTAASPCIDAGDNTAVPEGIDTDLDGNPRFLDVPETADTGNGTLPIVDMGAYESLGDGCLAVTSQQIVCHADGTTFTVNIEGLAACSGGTTQVTFTASGGSVGEQLCFTALVNDGGFCCSTEICVTIPDCTTVGLPNDLNGDGIVGMVDLLALLGVWGACSDCGACPADFDGDCAVGVGDLLIILGGWT